jgi:predicted membrane channel-forming protein YqfA (hemolysin III family)
MAPLPENDNNIKYVDKKNKRNVIKSREGHILSFPKCLCLEHSRCYFIDEIPDGWPPYPLIESGYRCNLGWLRSFLTIFQTSHNEVWYIWTDLGPLLLFLIIAIYHINTNRFINADNNLRLLEYGVLIGIITCRATSTFYHIFNCVNLWTSQHLIQVDLIGIASTCLASPYFYILGNQNSADIVFDENFVSFCTILFSIQGIATIMFLSNMIFGESRITLLLEQPILCAIAAYGNWSGVRIIMSKAPFVLRAHCAAAIISLVLGYVICFLWKYPERLFPPGTSDGKLWNSHSIWHIMLFICQLSLLSVPVLYS